MHTLRLLDASETWLRLKSWLPKLNLPELALELLCVYIYICTPTHLHTRFVHENGSPVPHTDLYI